MSYRFLSPIALGFVLLLSAGCYSTQEGRLNFGVPFTKDTIVNRYEMPYQKVYEAAKEVLKRNGMLTNDDQVTRVLRGVVDTRSIWIKLDDSEAKLTKVTVQARTRGGAADVDMASEIATQIYGLLIPR